MTTFPITDTALDEALRALLNAPVHGVKVILTSRVAPRALLFVQPERQRRLDLDQGLDSPHAEQVLRARDPDGRLGPEEAPDRCLPRRGSGPGVTRARWRRSRRSWPPTGTPRCPNCSPRRPGCPTTWWRRWSGRRSTGWTRWRSRSCRRWPSTRPVPPVAVDYLLQPYRPAVDAAPVLGGW